MIILRVWPEEGEAIVAVAAKKVTVRRCVACQQLAVFAYVRALTVDPENCLTDFENMIL
jgi:hypothetical protein